MTVDLSEYHQMFFDEAAEHLQTMEHLLLGLDLDAPDHDQLNSIFRAAHSIKGGAGTFGFSDMAEVTHLLESLLDRLRNRSLAPTSAMIDAFLAATDVLVAQLQAHRHGDTADKANASAIMLRLAQLAIASPPIVVRQDSAPSEHELGYGFFEPVDGESAATQSPIGGESGTGLLSDSGYGFFDEMPPSAPREHSAAEVQAPQQTALEDSGFGFFEPLDTKPVQDPGYGFFEPLPPETGSSTHQPESVAPAAPVSSATPTAAIPTPSLGTPQPAATDSQPSTAPAQGGSRRDRHPRSADQAPEASIRVGVERVDQLINLVGELVITHAMLAQTATRLDPVEHEQLLAGMAQLERNTRDLQDSVMSIRMMPMSVVFSRFPRLVRELARQLGKDVQLNTEGETTELDRGLVEKIIDPLTHLVRNSLDHGIEPPEQRRELGKSSVGQLSLRAAHHGGSIVIEVEDDGRGLNRERLIAKAIERGIHASESMPDSEAWQLIFAPGFSTADVVTDVSGRGVGMDVVKRNIDALGGRVDLWSQPGVGTRISIRLPLTLAILDGMTVEIGGNIFIIPLASIRESLQAKSEDLRSIAGQGRVLQIRGDYLPVLSLAAAFGLEGRTTSPIEGIAIVVESGRELFALHVDAILGQQQVVIKSLEQNYRRVEGIAGATILGDGRVALILDLQGLLRMARGQGVLQ